MVVYFRQRRIEGREICEFVPRDKDLEVLESKMHYCKTVLVAAADIYLDPE